MRTSRKDVDARLEVLTRYTGIAYRVGKQMEGYRVETGDFQNVSPRYRSLKTLLEWVEGAIKGAESLWLTRAKNITFFNDDADRFALCPDGHWVMEGRQIVVGGVWVAMWENSAWTVKTPDGEKRFRNFRVGG